jgi:hypothetical protein
MGWVLTGKGIIVRNPETLYIEGKPFARFGLLGENDHVDNPIEGKHSGCTVLWFSAVGDVGSDILLKLQKRDIINVVARVRISDMAEDRYGDGVGFIVTSYELVEKGRPIYGGIGPPL